MIQAAIYQNSSLFHHVVSIEFSTINGEHSFFCRSSYKYPPASFETLLSNKYINQYYTNVYKTNLNMQYQDCFFKKQLKCSCTTIKNYSEIWNSYRKAFISNLHVVFVVHKSVDANFSISVQKSEQIKRIWKRNQQEPDMVMLLIP